LRHAEQVALGCKGDDDDVLGRDAVLIERGAGRGEIRTEREKIRERPARRRPGAGLAIVRGMQGKGNAGRAAREE